MARQLLELAQALGLVPVQALEQLVVVVLEWASRVQEPAVVLAWAQVEVLQELQAWVCLVVALG